MGRFVYLILSAKYLYARGFLSMVAKKVASALDVLKAMGPSAATSDPTIMPMRRLSLITLPKVLMRALRNLKMTTSVFPFPYSINHLTNKFLFYAVIGDNIEDESESRDESRDETALHDWGMDIGKYIQLQ